MTLPLNPETLKQAYEYLNVTPPFKTWNMPDSDDVLFKVVRSPTLRGWHQKKNGKHIIAVSSKCIGQTHSLVEVMAHEMAHAHQADVGMESPHAQHNAAFTKLSEQICRVHGFDPLLF